MRFMCINKRYSCEIELKAHSRIQLNYSSRNKMIQFIVEKG